MKKIIILILFLASIVMSASADAVLVNGIYYDLVGSVARVTKNPNKYKGTVWIPPYIEYGGYKFEVTSIKSNAFESCKQLTEVTIPSTITSIESYAFEYCTALKAVHITDMNAWLKIVFGDKGYANPLLYAHHLYLNGEEITSLNIPNNITCLKGAVFCGWSSLTSVTIPNSVTTIEFAVFEDCKGLTSISIPNSVTSIGVHAFYGCSGLTSISIPNSVATIGNGCFVKCDGLSSITLSNSITSIGNNLFWGCTSLKSITIPNNVVSIGNSAFFNCTSLTSITLPNSLTSIGKYAFDGCNSLTSVSIPNNVTSIDEYAFMGCTNLTSIIVESGNKKYDSRNSCNAIIETARNTLIIGCNNTIIPNSVTSIGDHAFLDCSGLISITIPQSVTSIGESAFSNCNALNSVNILCDLTSVTASTFTGCPNIKEVLFDCEQINSIIKGHSSISKITMTNKVSTIGDFAFEKCYGITSITIPNSVTYIGEYAFRDCEGLTSITIPNNVTYIGEYAFSDCYRLTSVVIGKSVKEMKDAFSWCNHITDVYCYAEIVPTISYKTFTGATYGPPIYYNDATLHVPTKCIDMYRNAEEWKGFKKIVALTDSDPKPTGIININSDAHNEEMYFDLQGRRVSEPSKGLYIINGKKVLMK